MLTVLPYTPFSIASIVCAANNVYHLCWHNNNNRTSADSAYPACHTYYKHTTKERKENMCCGVFQNLFTQRISPIYTDCFLVCVRVIPSQMHWQTLCYTFVLFQNLMPAKLCVNRGFICEVRLVDGWRKYENLTSWTKI